jgi:hypothetical protein
LSKGETLVKPRLQPLKFAPGTELIAMVRIESEQAAHDPEQLEAALSAFDSLTSLSEVRMIQVDFDAGVSERAFYREMLNALRQRTPAEKRISITALASWCMHDDWLTGLPAALLDNDDAARALAPALREPAPEMKTQLAAYSDAKDAAERKDAALYVLLKFPGMRPRVHVGLARLKPYTWPSNRRASAAAMSKGESHRNWLSIRFINNFRTAPGQSRRSFSLVWTD